MELYKRVSYEVSRIVTQRYSTSFSMSTGLFSNEVRDHIYAIYGMVRIADEIVDTYRGKDTAKLLNAFEAEVYESIERGYSTNPVLHSFALTAGRYGIDKSLIAPFFESMRMDLDKVIYTKETYKTYIYGSAEVVGLMCLRVFVGGDDKKYASLEKGGRALGSVYQEVNFLRDMAADYKELGRIYFPGVSYETFDETDKLAIIKRIEKDFARAKKAAEQLPEGSKKAVLLSIRYYGALLQKIKRTPASVLKDKRIRINNFRKIGMLVATKVSNDRG